MPRLVTVEAFRRFADLLPEGMLLLAGDGTVLAANAALGRRVGCPAESLAATPLAALVTEPSAAEALVAAWTRSERFVPGDLTLRVGAETLRCRAEGAAVGGAPDAAARVLVRLRPEAEAGEGVVGLDPHVRALSAELPRRRRVENELRHRESDIREIADAMPQMVWTAEPDGALDFYNRQWVHYTGRTVEETLGWGWEPVVHPDDRDAVRESWAAARRSGDPITVEARFRRADGAYRWHLCRALPLHDEEGRIVRWVGTSTDIEDTKRAEEDRRVSAQRWKFLAQASAVLASSLDAEQVLRTVARLSVPALADWCSVDVLEAEGTVRRVAVSYADPSKQDLLDRAATYPPDPDARHPRTTVLRTGESVLVPEVSDDYLAHMAADAEHLEALRRLAYRSAMIVPVAARGRVLGALTFATTADSERRYGPEDLALAENLAGRAALALDNARLYAEAQEANRLKDEFLATVSHELRTPLASMMNWVALLRQGKVGPAQVAKGLDVLQRAGEAQARLIDDILDMSRIVSGRLRLRPRLVELSDVVREAVETVRAAADAKHVTLEAAHEPGGARVLGDPERLQQVVWNLLANAVKFTPDGGRVRVGLERRDTHAALVVRDTGEGIAPEFLPYVFDRFRQAEPVARRRHAGLGLGLAIVKHLVEAHGGHVEAQSEGVGRGATFVVRLPLAPHA